MKYIFILIGYIKLVDWHIDNKSIMRYKMSRRKHFQFVLEII